jgi:hypothetical protein
MRAGTMARYNNTTSSSRYIWGSKRRQRRQKQKAKSIHRTRQNGQNKTSRIQQEEQETTGGTTKDKRYGKAGNNKQQNKKNLKHNRERKARQMEKAREEAQATPKGVMEKPQEDGNTCKYAQIAQSSEERIHLAQHATQRTAKPIGHSTSLQFRDSPWASTHPSLVHTLSQEKEEKHARVNSDKENATVAQHIGDGGTLESWNHNWMAEHP